MKIPLCIGLPVLLVVIMLVLLGGCTGKVQQEAGPGAGSAAELGEPFRPITLQEGLLDVDRAFVREENATGPFPLYFIQGRGVSREGKAEQWIFGVKYGEGNYILLAESDDAFFIPVDMDLPENELQLSAIVDPATLITMNGPLISRTFNTPEASLIVDLEVSENIYSLTPEGANAYKILYFDALTGKTLN